MTGGARPTATLNGTFETVILRCTFEELSALTTGAKFALEAASTCDDTRIAAPSEVVADVEALVPRLDGDLSVSTLAEEEQLERAVGFILSRLEERMNVLVLDQYVGSDDAINAYFDYAYVLRVHDRLESIAEEMHAMVELMTGEPPTEASKTEITFPD